MWIGSCLKINTYLELSEHLNSIKNNLDVNNNFSPFQVAIQDSTDKIKAEDSLKVIPDSLLKKNKTVKVDEDSLELLQMSIDSTARLENLKYRPQYLQFVKFKSKRISPLFLQPSATYRTRTVDIDSSGKFVIIKEFIYGIQSKVLLKIPIDEYINLQLESNKTN